MIYGTKTAQLFCRDYATVGFGISGSDVRRNFLSHDINRQIGFDLIGKRLFRKLQGLGFVLRTELRDGYGLPLGVLKPQHPENRAGEN